MTIVKIPGISKVPVLIVGVYYLWAKKCFEKYKTDVLSAINKGLLELDWIKKFFIFKTLIIFLPGFFESRQ